MIDQGAPCSALGTGEYSGRWQELLDWDGFDRSRQGFDKSECFLAAQYSVV